MPETYSDLPKGAQVIGYSDLPPGATVIDHGPSGLASPIPPPEFHPSVPNPMKNLEGEQDVSGLTVAHDPTFVSRMGGRIQQNVNLIPNAMDAIKRQMSGQAPTEQDKQIIGMGNSMRTMVGGDDPSTMMTAVKGLTVVPRMLYQTAKGYAQNPSDLAGDIVTGYLGHEMSPSSPTPQPTARPTAAPDLAQSLTSALKKSNKVNVYQESQRAIPAIQEAADLRGITANHFQGQNGIQLGRQLIDHALDVAESRFAQAMGPIAKDRVPLRTLQDQYPQLADKLTSPNSPWVAKNGTPYVSMEEIDAARKSANNLLRSKGTFMMEPTKAAVMEQEAKAISSQGRDVIYNRIKDTGGPDVRPLKQTESSLLKLKDVMDATAKDLSKRESDFATSPLPAKPSYGLRDIPISKSGAVHLASKYLERQAPPPVSPAELFNQRMRQIVGAKR